MCTSSTGTGTKLMPGVQVRGRQSRIAVIWMTFMYMTLPNNSSIVRFQFLGISPGSSQWPVSIFTTLIRQSKHMKAAAYNLTVTFRIRYRIPMLNVDSFQSDSLLVHYKKHITSLIRSLPYDRSTASSKASSPQHAIHCALVHFPVSSRFHKVIKYLLTSSSSSSRQC